jgi:acetyltransferase-like isoleucine patch superfamily enzyme
MIFLRKAFSVSCRLYHHVLIFMSFGHEGFLRSVARTTSFQSIRQLAWKRTGIKLGEQVFINHSITILDDAQHKVTVGDRVAFSPNVVLITASSPNDSLLTKKDYAKRFIKRGEIVIGADSWIGAGVVIQPGLKIGKRCIIGSMSNVNKDIPDDYLAYGNPVRLIRRLDAD